MITAEELCAKLRTLKPVIKDRYKATELALFGSVIRGEQAGSSDIDILAEFEDGADLLDLVGLAIFLEEELQLQVDLVPKGALREELRDTILREALPV